MKSTSSVLNIFTLCCCCLLSVCYSQNCSQEWNYENPNSWPLCYPLCSASVNTFQSPVEIINEIYDATLPRVSFNYNDPPEGVTMSYAPHRLNLQFPSHYTGGYVLNPTSSAMQPRRGILQSLHFHTPNEHIVKIPNHHFDMEMHMVHLDLDNRTVVISTLWSISDESGDQPWLGQVLRALQNFTWTNQTRPSMHFPGLGGLFQNLPDSSYWHYNGTLTIPPCTAVEWFIFHNKYQYSPAQAEILHSYLRNNTRPIQRQGQEVKLYRVSVVPPPPQNNKIIGIILGSVVALFVLVVAGLLTRTACRRGYATF